MLRVNNLKDRADVLVSKQALRGRDTAPPRVLVTIRSYSICYRGFEPKTGGIRIITFRDTTRMQSKSNRCI